MKFRIQIVRLIELLFDPDFQLRIPQSLSVDKRVDHCHC